MKRLLAVAICAVLLLPGIARAETKPNNDVSAEAAYLIEANSGRVLYAKNENAHLPMASTTKIMTALLAVESGRMEETVTVPDAAVGTEGSSMYLKRGETLKLSDLVYGLLLTSGNDAAVAIACVLDGSTAAFADHMNARARELHLSDTHFVTPNGLHDPNHYTSAHDLALLGAAALENPVFAGIAATQYCRTEGSNPHTLKNKNRLLWEYEGGELAVDVDPTALYEKSDGKGNKLPKLTERLFRAVDTGADSTYAVFAPTLRDASLVNGLNQLLIRFEDLCGLSRGTFSDANVDARTATELKIVKQRSYATVADNQKALEKCLRDVLRAMDVYATLYGLAPEGEYAASFEWDDSILTDVDQQLQQRLLLVNSGIMSKAELRQWYLGETEAAAEAAVKKIQGESAKVEDDDDFIPRE